MGSFLKLFALLSLLPITANAIYIPGPVGTELVCNSLTLSTQNLIRLHCRFSGGSSTTSCRRPNDTAGYTAGMGINGGVNAANGKAFRVLAVQMWATTGSAGTGPQLLSSTNDLGWTGNVSASGAVYEHGSSSGNDFVIPLANAYAGNALQQFMQCYTTYFKVVNASFVSFKGDGTSAAQLEVWGIEE